MSTVNTVKKPTGPTHNRWEAIIRSQMHGDAVAILSAAESLQTLLSGFIETYEFDEADQILRDAGCSRPTDGTPDRDRISQWSEGVLEDVTGLKWALTCFVASLDPQLGSVRSVATVSAGQSDAIDADDADADEPTAIVVTASAGQ